MIIDAIAQMDDFGPSPYAYKEGNIESISDNLNTLKKMGKGKFNYKEVLDTKVIGPDELKKSFGYDFEVLDDLKED